jgi:hypothetical protein
VVVGHADTCLVADDGALRIDPIRLSVAREALYLRLDRADRLLPGLDPVDDVAALLTLVGEWRSPSECEGMLTGLARQADLAPAEMSTRLERTFDAVAAIAAGDDPNTVRRDEV